VSRLVDAPGDAAPGALRRGGPVSAGRGAPAPHAADSGRRARAGRRRSGAASRRGRDRLLERRTPGRARRLRRPPPARDELIREAPVPTAPREVQTDVPIERATRGSPAGRPGRRSGDRSRAPREARPCRPLGEPRKRTRARRSLPLGRHPRRARPASAETMAETEAARTKPCCSARATSPGARSRSGWRQHAGHPTIGR
jgi:hypothetical protein